MNDRKIVYLDIVIDVDKIELWKDRFRLLSNKHNLRIIKVLCEQGKTHSTGFLAHIPNICLSDVSTRLRKLREAGLIVLQSQGKYRYYSINRNTMEKVNEIMDL